MTLTDTLAGLKMLNSRGGFLAVYVTQDEIAALAHAVEWYQKLVQAQAEPPILVVDLTLEDGDENGQQAGEAGAL